MTEKDSQHIVSLNNNLLTMAENVDLAIKERDRYKEALEKIKEMGDNKTPTKYGMIAMHLMADNTLTK